MLGAGCKQLFVKHCLVSASIWTWCVGYSLLDDTFNWAIANHLWSLKLKMFKNLQLYPIHLQLQLLLFFMRASHNHCFCLGDTHGKAPLASDKKGLLIAWTIQSIDDHTMAVSSANCKSFLLDVYKSNLKHLSDHLHYTGISHHPLNTHCTNLLQPC